MDIVAFIVSDTTLPTSTPVSTGTTPPTATNSPEPSQTPTITWTAAVIPTGTVLPAGSTVDDTDERVRYLGTWTAITIAGPVNNTNRYTSLTGASASMTFTGNQIAYIYPRAAGRGVARVSIDGVTHVDISLNSTTSTYWQNVWTSGLLNEGTHTITITSLGGGYVDMGAFTVSGVQEGDFAGAGTYDDRSGNLQYFGKWYQYDTTGPYLDTVKYTDKDNTNVSLGFNGSRVRLVYTGSTNRGTADIYIDNVLRAVINMNQAEFAWGQTWDSPDLGPADNHVIKIVRRSNQPGMYIDIDAIIVE